MSSLDLPWLDPNNPDSPYPDPDTALDDPEGLLAAGGDLTSTRILNAYNAGIFPWYQDDQPILWWSPNPRGVIYPKQFIAHKSVLRTLKRNKWHISFDQSFKQVIQACAEPRSYSEETWITHEMLEAYCELHRLGHAHSVEVWSSENQLVGGIYGLAIGRMFAGESMFSRANDASKIALLYLCAYLDTWGYAMVDTQLPSQHLSSLGGIAIQRDEYLNTLAELRQQSVKSEAWQPGMVMDINTWLAQRTSSLA